MYSEKEILTKLGWSENNSDSLGTLKYSKTDTNLTNTKTLSIERDAEKVFIIFQNHKIAINKKEKLVTLTLPKNSDDTIDFSKVESNWDITKPEDINAIVDHLQHVAMTMNVKPSFLFTETKKKTIKM